MQNDDIPNLTTATGMIREGRVGYDSGLQIFEIQNWKSQTTIASGLQVNDDRIQRLDQFSARSVQVGALTQFIKHENRYCAQMMIDMWCDDSALMIYLIYPFRDIK